MTLETIYYIGQSFAVLALICSLLFVGYQVRQSRLIERAAAQRELLNGVIHFSHRISSTEWGDSFAVGLADFENCNPTVKSQFSALAAEFVFITESALNMHRDGFFSEGTWIGIEGGALAIIRTPGGSQWWQYARKAIGPEVVEHLDQRLAAIDPSAPTFLDAWPWTRDRLAELRGEK